ncbi:MAG: hypothetical protein WCK33_12370 [Phycisphaerae bacterium]
MEMSHRGFFERQGPGTMPISTCPLARPRLSDDEEGLQVATVNAAKNDAGTALE